MHFFFVFLYFSAGKNLWQAYPQYKDYDKQSDWLTLQLWKGKVENLIGTAYDDEEV